MRNKVFHEKDKPLWYDVYAKFPPIEEPKFSIKPENIKVREIFYPEDIVRAKIHKEFSDKLGTLNLHVYENETMCQKWIKLYNGYIAQGMNEDTAFEELKKIVDGSNVSDMFKRTN